MSAVETHPARKAAEISMAAVHAKDKEAWIANFADDCIVEDPIGKSPLDPTGEGHRGKAAVAAFWDANIGPNRVMFNIHHSYASGNELANVGTITTRLANGVVTMVNGVFTYRVDAGGKVEALRAYWEIANMIVYPPMD